MHIYTTYIYICVYTLLMDALSSLILKMLLDMYLKFTMISLGFLSALLVPSFKVCISFSTFHTRGIPQISSGHWLPIHISVIGKKQLSRISVGLMWPVSFWTQCFFRGVECWTSNRQTVLVPTLNSKTILFGPGLVVENDKYSLV